LIWVVGDKGMLGREICEQLAMNGIEFTGSDREVDITDQLSIENFAKRMELEWIINCAAYTAVDLAEKEADIAERINSTGAENLGLYAEKRGAKIVHFSTDYVFDGTKREPYVETDTPNPQSVYGRTKLDGELRLMKAAARYFIIRIAWLYGPFGKNFAATMLRLFGEKDVLTVVADQTGTPTYTRTLAENIVLMVLSATDKYGIYHYTDGGVTTWHGFANEIYRLAEEAGLLKHEVEIKPIPAKDYPTPAKRPAYSVLSKDKVTSALGFAVNDWKDNLKHYFTRLDIK